MLKKIFKVLSLVILAAIIVVLALAAMKPDAFHVERSVLVQAPPEKIQPALDDFHRWGAWSPWEKLDPAMQRTFSGPSSGPGSVYEWAGNSKVGKGRMEILESSPAGVAIKLDFLEPFEGHNTARFTLHPQDGATTVTWSMDGPSPFISKVMQVFCDMDKMIGKDFEAGLANLKALAEK